MLSVPRILFISLTSDSDNNDHQRVDAINRLGTLDCRAIIPETCRLDGAASTRDIAVPLFFRVPQHVYLSHLPFAVLNPNLVRKINGVIQAFNPDIIHLRFLHDGFGSALFCHFVRRTYPNIKIVLETDPCQHNQLRFPFNLFARFTYSYVHFVIGSTDVALSAAKRLGYSGKAALVAKSVSGDVFRPRGQSISRLRFGMPQDKRVMGYIGPLTKSAGLPFLLDALTRCDQTTSCWIVGDGPEKKSIIHTITTLGLQDRVVVLPMQYATPLAELYSAFDGIVMPAITQEVWRTSAHRVCLEASQVECSIVVPEATITRETLANDVFMFENGNVDALVDVLNGGSLDSDLANTMAVSLKHRVGLVSDVHNIAPKLAAIWKYLHGESSEPAFTVNL